MSILFFKKRMSENKLFPIFISIESPKEELSLRYAADLLRIFVSKYGVDARFMARCQDLEYLAQGEELGPIMTMVKGDEDGPELLNMFSWVEYGQRVKHLIQERCGIKILICTDYYRFGKFEEKRFKSRGDHHPQPALVYFVGEDSGEFEIHAEERGGNRIWEVITPKEESSEEALLLLLRSIRKKIPFDLIFNKRLEFRGVPAPLLVADLDHYIREKEEGV